MLRIAARSPTTGNSSLRPVHCFSHLSCPRGLGVTGLSSRRSTILMAAPSQPAPSESEQQPPPENSSSSSSPSSSASNDQKEPSSKPSAPPPKSNKRQQQQPKKGGFFSWLASKLGEDNMLLRLIFNGVMLYVLFRTFPLPGTSKGQDIAEGDLTFAVPYSTFINHVKSNQVSAVTVEGQNVGYRLRPDSPFAQTIRKTFLDGIPDNVVSELKVKLSSVRPNDFPTPYDTLLKNNVTFQAIQKEDRWSSSLVLLFYMVAIAWVLSQFSSRLGGGANTAGGKRHKNGPITAGPASVTFDDVAGVDEAKEELQEVVEFLKSPERFHRLGSRPPSGVLLVGPPGTGKTLLAKAVAAEAGVPFFSISASEFVELYVGMGASRVRDLFSRARKESPAIVFIDEIDAIGKGRDSRIRSGGNEEREQTLNQLLTELDGFDSNKENTVICIAATNRPDVLDSALLRPGRFDRRISVEPPDRIGRLKILESHVRRRELPLAPGVDLGGLAAATTGFTGADLANLVNEAALLAGRRASETVDQQDFNRAILRAIAGIEKKRSLMGNWERSVVAKHEVGHALVSTAVSSSLPFLQLKVEKLSIVPRTGGSLGLTYIPPSTEDRSLMFDSEIRGRLAMLMGGRAAEELTVGPVSTGAMDDIRRATSLAYRSVAEFGLSTAIGPINVPQLLAGSEDGAMFRDSGSAMSVLVESEAKALLDGALVAAREVIEANRTLHEQLSVKLATEEKIEGSELNAMLEKVAVPESVRTFLAGNTSLERLEALVATYSEPGGMDVGRALPAAGQGETFSSASSHVTGCSDRSHGQAQEAQSPKYSAFDELEGPGGRPRNDRPTQLDGHRGWGPAAVVSDSESDVDVGSGPPRSLGL